MRRRFVLILSLLVLLSSMIYVRSNAVEVKAYGSIDTAKVYGVKLLWSNLMSVNDVAVSKDGNYIAAVNNTGVYYFAYDNSTPKWWYWSYGASLSVAISADGEYVVAGGSGGYIYYFNDSRATTGERTYSWFSSYLQGPVQRGTLDMSDDGEYVVVGGTGTSIYYFAQCRARSSQAEYPTWSRFLSAWDVLAVDMSPDGKCVAAGGTNSSTGFVIFYNNASGATDPYEPSWDSWSSINGGIIDLAVSDDGYAVVAVDEAAVGTLYYWANATASSGDPDATWTNYMSFKCVDMSADGDNVVAGRVSMPPASLHFWSNATERHGQQDEDWVDLESANVTDVAINGDGGIIAASGQTGETYSAYFITSDRRMIYEFGLPQSSPLVSMSGNGNITAFGGGVSPDSLYVFELLIDSTPPSIENVYQEPESGSVYPDDKVMVYANVTDDESGVKQVILNYTYTNNTGTWHGTITMDNLVENLYNGTIPRLPYCTNVTYMIIAEDNFNNTIISEEIEYRYHVIPEFPPQIILPVFFAVTLLTAILSKRKLFRRTKI